MPQLEQATRRTGFMPGPPPEIEQSEVLFRKDVSEDYLEKLDQAFLPARGKDEERALMQKVALIARVFGGQYGVKLVPHESNGWAVTVSEETVKAVEEYMLGKRPTLDDLPDEAFKVSTMLYGKKDILSAPELVVLGVTRHEIGHILHTDFRLWFAGQKLATQQGNLATTFHHMYNALEDCWINLKEAGSSPVVREQMEALYLSHTPNILKLINLHPRTTQLGFNIMYYWMYGEQIPTLKRPAVSKAFERIQTHVDDFFWGASSQENFDNLCQNIWPEFQKLEELDRAEYERRALLSKIPGLGKGSFGSSPNGKPAPGKGKSSGKGLIEKLRKSFGGGDKDEDLGKKLEKKMSPKLKEDLKKHSENPEENEITPDMIEELDKLLRSLSEKERQKLQEQALAELDEDQAKELAKNPPPGMEVTKDKKTGRYSMRYKKSPKASEVRKGEKELERMQKEMEKESRRAEREREKQEQETPSKKEQREKKLKDMETAGFDESAEELYDEYVTLENEVRGTSDQLERQLRRYHSKEAGALLRRKEL